MEKPAIDYLIRQSTAMETLYLRGYMSHTDYTKAKDDIFRKIKDELFPKEDKIPKADFDVILAAAIAHSAGYISKTEYDRIVKDLEVI